LRSADEVKRLHAGWLLGRMGPAAKEAVPTLLELLKDGSAQNRKLAAWTLGYIGQGAVEAIPALLVAIRDADEGVRKMACAALDRISPFGTQDRAA
jgi:HEAT repeat protein